MKNFKFLRSLLAFAILINFLGIAGFSEILHLIEESEENICTGHDPSEVHFHQHEKCNFCDKDFSTGKISSKVEIGSVTFFNIISQPFSDNGFNSTRFFQNPDSRGSPYPAIV